MDVSSENSGAKVNVSKVPRIAANLLLMLIASLVAVSLAELGARLFLNPVDYLSPTLIRDDVLGIRVPPGGSGHDSWGFRNAKVPKSAEIVALGDSHTYGNCARMDESWPAVSGRILGMSIYNLGMGGYGPNQYYHLFNERALSLKPKWIVCGLYMGDDFDNAYRITYGLDHWAWLRAKTFGKVEADIWEAPAKGRWDQQLRNWLSKHSIIYRIVVHGIVLGKLKGDFQIDNAQRLYPSTTTLILKDKNIREAFSPNGLLRGLDQKSSSVLEGMRITENLLSKMNEICASNQIHFLVVIIPTKESVFNDFFPLQPDLLHGDVIQSVIENERLARNKLRLAFDQATIAYVDALPAMRQAVGQKKLYTNSARDMHPNASGYQVIAETASKYIKSFGR